VALNVSFFERYTLSQSTRANTFSTKLKIYQLNNSMNKQDKTSNCQGYINGSTLEELKQLTRFTPVNNKKPYLKQWQNNPKNINFCEQEIKAGKANGYGLITGKGLLAIDFDGCNAHKIAKAIGKWLTEIDTLAWSSGKQSRKQILVKIPQHRLKDFQKLSRKELSNFGNVEAVENEQLEIRYNRCQSVLPPSAHPETGQYFWLNTSNIVELNDYQCNCILSAIDTDIQSNTKQYQELTDVQQLKLIENALETIPSNNYHDWVTIGMALKNSGYDLTLWENWSRNSIKYKIGECEEKWRSFNGSGTSLGTLFWLAKQHSFKQKQWYRDNRETTKTTLEKTYHRSSNDTPENNIGLLLNQLITELANPIIKEDVRIAKVTEFSGQFHLSPNTILKAIDSRITEDYKDVERESLAINLDNIIAKSQEKLDISYIVGGYLGACIEDIASKIPTAPEAILCGLLPMVASLIGTQAKIIVKASADYVVPFIIRTAIIGDSGQKKSPALNAAIRALTNLHIAKGKEYKKELQNWELNQETETTKKPIRKRQIVKDTTFDGLVKIHQENPTGLLNVVDELAGYFKRMNKFNRNGSGDDVQRDLELYNGTSYEKTRADDSYDIYLEKTAISVTGTIQWHTLENLGIDADDGTGTLARWLFCAVNLPDGYFNSDSDNTSDYFTITDLLVEKLATANINSDFILSKDALKNFAQWQHGLINAQKKINNHRLAIKYPKIEGEAIRIAGILHCIDCILNGEGTISLSINGDVMKRAIYLANWFLGQYAYVCTKCDTDTLDGKLAKLLQIIARKGECTAGEAFLANKSTFKNTKEVGELMIELVELDKVEKISTKKG
jgi:hypothetical protein